MEQEVQELFKNTELTLEQIASKLGIGYKVVWNIVANSFSAEERRERKIRNYSKSKTGKLNPMKGKTMEEHPRYTGEVADGKGYIIVLKPEWYTGRKGSRHVFKHHVVMCEALGLTEMPAGFVVHHIDGDITNNNLNNLALVTAGGHSRLHWLERCND